jgi:KipI family sensor histidine kinase inhibitor
VKVHLVGADALLVEVDDTAAATALYRGAVARGVVARDIVPAARTVLLDGLAERDRVAAEIVRWSGASEGSGSSGSSSLPDVPRPHAPSSSMSSAHLVEVPTVYDGPDLEDVARLWEMTTAELVATHTGTEFTVGFCGFAPGFPYCTGLPPGLHVPRLNAPRPRVPAGSVGLAGEFTGIYPSASPGGWRLVGRTDLPLWDGEREQPATLPPGTRVRFVQA